MNDRTNKLAQSYIVDKFFVSTAYRRASTPDEIWYYETIVWSWNRETKKRGEIIITRDAGTFYEQAAKCHFEVCVSLIYGEFEVD